MNLITILLVFSVVGCVQVSGQNSAGSNYSGVYLPSYATYVIGFTVLILVLAIVYLTYALIKVKSHQYKIMNDVSLPANVQVDKCNQNTCNRQESVDAPTLCNSTVVTPCDEVIIEDSFFERATSCSSSNLVDNETSTPNMKHKSKILPMIKKSVNSQFILPEDKMKEICIGVLKNRKSIKDFHEFDCLIEKRTGGKIGGLAREKSASTSVLDNLTYDTHQAQSSSNNQNIKNEQDSAHNRNETNNEDTINNASGKETEKNIIAKDISNEISVENNDENDYNEHTDEIYDCPPLPKVPLPKNIRDAESGSDCGVDIEEDEIYDCPPVPKEVDGDVGVGNVGIGGDEVDEIYDSPPSTSTTKKIIIEDTEYLIVIDPAIDEFKKEPSYINANKNDFNIN